MSVRTNSCICIRALCAGELIGLEYLYSQTNLVWDPDAPDGTEEADDDCDNDNDSDSDSFEEKEPEEFCHLAQYYALLHSAEPCGAPATTTISKAMMSELGPNKKSSSQDDDPLMEVQQAEGKQDVSNRMPVFMCSVRVSFVCAVWLHEQSLCFLEGCSRA